MSESQKVLEFSESLYEDLQKKILADGKAIAEMIRSGEVLALVQNADGTYSAEKFDEALDAYEARTPEDQRPYSNDHSGASWSAVRWAAVQMALGYAVHLTGTDLVYSL